MSIIDQYCFTKGNSSLENGVCESVFVLLYWMNICPEPSTDSPPVVINIHYKSTQNIGDIISAPSLYFPLRSKAKHLDATPDPCHTLIIGGGGLLHPGLSKRVESHLAGVSNSIVAWGIGTNTSGILQGKHPDWLGKCALVGLRDFPSKYEWVPCASCMSVEFDRQLPPVFEAVVYRHHWAGENIPNTQGMPVMTNKASKLADVVDFLLSGEVVITNTYHGMYWATLLGRKVIVYPFCSRHHHAKHVPTLVTNGSHWQDVLPETVTYPAALSECREANLAFYEKVRRLIP